MSDHITSPAPPAAAPEVPFENPSSTTAQALSEGGLAAPLAAPADVRFHRLLVAVDGSQHAALALAEAIALARRDHATITLLTVAPEVRTTSWIMAAVDPARLQADADAAAQKALRAAADLVPQDISLTTIFRRGHAAHEIVAQVRGGSYDAVVLGARGLGRVAGMVGSVSQHVLHHAGIAVLVAHAPDPHG